MGPVVHSLPVDLVYDSSPVVARWTDPVEEATDPVEEDEYCIVGPVHNDPYLHPVVKVVGHDFDFDHPTFPEVDHHDFDSSHQMDHDFDSYPPHYRFVVP